MRSQDAFKCVAAALFLAGSAHGAGAANAVASSEKKMVLEAVRPDVEEGLGLTLEQKNKIKAVREDFRARQQAIKNDLNARHEALRQELDGTAPSRSAVEPVMAQIKGLQGQLLENRIDIVFKLREIYTPAQIKKIKARIETRGKESAVKKRGRKVVKAPAKKE